MTAILTRGSAVLAVRDQNAAPRGVSVLRLRVIIAPHPDRPTAPPAVCPRLAPSSDHQCSGLLGDFASHSLFLGLWTVKRAGKGFEFFSRGWSLFVEAPAHVTQTCHSTEWTDPKMFHDSKTLQVCLVSPVVYSLSQCTTTISGF